MFFLFQSAIFTADSQFTVFDNGAIENCIVQSQSHRERVKKNAEEAEILVNLKQVICAFAAVLIVVKNEDRFYVSASATADL